MEAAPPSRPRALILPRLRFHVPVLTAKPQPGASRPLLVDTGGPGTGPASPEEPDAPARRPRRACGQSPSPPEASSRGPARVRWPAQRGAGRQAGRGGRDPACSRSGQAPPRSAGEKALGDAWPQMLPERLRPHSWSGDCLRAINGARKGKQQVSRAPESGEQGSHPGFFAFPSPAGHPSPTCCLEVTS